MDCESQMVLLVAVTCARTEPGCVQGDWEGAGDSSEQCHGPMEGAAQEHQAINSQVSNTGTRDTSS